MLPELLTGVVNVQTLLYPDGDVATTEVAYRTNAVSRNLNQLAASRAAETARRSGRAVRVLELGAGIGTTAADLLPALGGTPAGIGEYRYTDLSSFFLHHGRERFGSAPYLRFEVLDIDDIGPENIEQLQVSGLCDLDLVVAGTMAHNARDVDRLAAGLTGILAPGGRLILIEPVREHAQSLTTMPFALSTATGAPRRTDLRAGTTRTYLSAQEWTDVLTGAGFRVDPILPAPHDPLRAFSQALITATNDQRRSQ
nr:class I SAM-dependent methyltransferase [Kineosporia babensis]